MTALPAKKRPVAKIAAIGGVTLLLMLAVGAAVLTSAAPLVRTRPVPTAEEAGAGREAVQQVRAGLSGGNGQARIVLGTAQLDGLSALASHGFRPERLSLRLDRGAFIAAGSYRLPAGRWLNVMAMTQGSSAAFPATRLTVGKLHLSPSTSRLVLEGARLMIGLRGIALPPLDRMVRDVVIGSDRISATLFLPRAGLLADERGTPVDAGKVVRIYCALTQAEQASADTDFADQLRRTFAQFRASEDPVAFNRAALVALAMFIVDPHVGELAGSAYADSQSCRMPVQASSLHGRSDLPKHWILSAALTVITNRQLAQAMGEWKELSDSLSAQSRFALGDPSGFSLIDIAADRAGGRTAQVASSPERAREMALRLARANDEQLFPRQLLQGDELMSEGAFERRYGSIDAPRYRAAIAHIDRVLDGAGLD